jgi:N-acetylmuramoyl-L-alanine amidase
VRIFRPGDTGPEILDIQRRLVALGAVIDPSEMTGRFGSSTEAAVRAFQVRRSVKPDGLVGAETWGQLVEAGQRLGDRTLYLHAPMHRGDDVLGLQRKLNALGFDSGKEDGLFGPRTDRAVREFQRNVGEDADGVVGLHTVATLDRMRPLEGAPSRALVREREQLRQMRVPIEGQLVAIDAEPTGDDPSGGDVAGAVARELEAVGAKAILLEGTDEERDPAELARAANELGASVVVSVIVDSEATQCTCSYFGSGRSHSPVGMRLAGLILDELQAGLQLTGRMTGSAAALLRETRMPAVVVVVPDGHESEQVGRLIASGVRRLFRHA